MEFKQERTIMTRLIWDYVFRCLGARRHGTDHLEHSRMILNFHTAFAFESTGVERERTHEPQNTVWNILDSEDL